MLEELTECQKNKGFAVFDTLTINEQNYTAETLTKHFQLYKERIEYAIKLAATGDRKLARKVNTTDYVKHFAVIEEGGKNGRLHIHILWTMTDMPKLWQQDPNAKIVRFRKPIRREIKAMSKHWHYGNSSPIAIRMKGDGFAKLGWIKPYDRKKQRTRPDYTPLQMAKLCRQVYNKEAKQYCNG